MAVQDALVGRMQEHIGRWEQTGDKRAIFLSCYALMTRNMLDALDSDPFHDTAWVSHLLDHFAGYYFNALEAYDAATVGAPEVWQRAHEATRRSSASALTLLLLGVNAHINYDLVLAVADLLEPEWQALSEDDRRSRYEDYCHVNDVIGRTIDSVQDGILEPNEPVMAAVDTLFGPVDEWLVSRGIIHWRNEVWKHAIRRVEAQQDATREALRQQVEAAALRWARLIEV